MTPDKRDFVAESAVEYRQESAEKVQKSRCRSMQKRLGSLASLWAVEILNQMARRVGHEGQADPRGIQENSRKSASI